MSNYVGCVSRDHTYTLLVFTFRVINNLAVRNCIRCLACTLKYMVLKQKVIILLYIPAVM